MKLLLDESVPRRLAAFLPASFTLRTVQEMGWAGTGNGLLLQLAAAEGFEALVTVDRGIEHQQNVSELPIPVIIMRPPAVDWPNCSRSSPVWRACSRTLWKTESTVFRTEL